MLHMHLPNLNRQIEIDGLRGLAAVSVIFYHAILYTGDTASTTLLLPIQELGTTRDALTKIALMLVSGHSAVMLFFVLSGFVLTLSLERIGRINARVALDFGVRRIFRLYPALVVSLLVFGLVAVAYQVMGWGGFPSPSMTGFLQNAVLIKNVWIGPSYTVQLELLAAPFLLLFFVIKRMFGLPGTLVVLLYTLLAMGNPSLTFFAPEMDRWIFSFAVGMTLADPGWRAVFERVSPSALWGILMLYFFGRTFSPLVSHEAVVAQNIICAALIGSVCYAKHDVGLCKVLRAPGIQRLGQISYSLYLINVVFLLVIWSLVGDWYLYNERPLEVGIIVGIVASAISIPIASIMEQYVERWGVRVGKTLSIGPKVRSDPAVHAAP